MDISQKYRKERKTIKQIWCYTEERGIEPAPSTVLVWIQGGSRKRKYQNMHARKWKDHVLDDAVYKKWNRMCELLYMEG